jgi:hypothetical protein
MADDLTIVASLLKDTNKKLDKLHSDNEKNDTKGDIIKNALPEVLNDIYQSNRQIAQWKKEEERDKNTDNIIKKEDKKAAKREEPIQKIVRDIKEPLKTLGVAIPKITKPIFRDSKGRFAKPPSDLKLMVQALSPKALTEGFKVGLGDMFKEVGGGIKKIGGGMKSLATKGLTAAQRKSEEKEKDSKENKKDSFLKKMFGSTIKLLGGILKTVSLAAKAGFIALAGAGALYALAKLIESPSWKTVAGIIEYVLNKLDDIFTWAYNVGGPLGVLGTALAGWYGAKGILTLAGIGIKALAKKLFFEGATDTLAGSAGQATTSLIKKGGLLSALGRLGMAGGVAFLAAAAVYGLIKGMEALAERNAEFEKSRLSASQKRIAAVAESVDQGSSDAEIEAARKKLVREKAQAQQILDRSNQLVGKVNKEVAENALLTVEATQKALDQIPKVQRSFGSNPREMGKAINEAFRDAINSTTFTGDAKNRKAQIRGISDNVFRDFVKSKEFANLPVKQAQAALKNFQKTEFANLQRLIFDRDSTAKMGLKNRKELESVAAPLLMEINAERRGQIKDPTIIKLNDELRRNTEELKKMNDAKNGGKGDTTVMNSSVVGGNTNSVTIPPQVPMYGRFPNGGIHQYGEVY